MARWRKGCPRCNGEVFEELGMDGRSLICLQCGHSMNAAQEAALRDRLHRVPAAPQRTVTA